MRDSTDGDTVMAFGGDALVCHSIKAFDDEGFLKVVKLLREADVSVANLEVVANQGEDVATHVSGGSRGGNALSAPPSVIAELQWMGVKMVSAANNHSADFGENGIITNIKYLDSAGMPHAGTGRNLSEATAPAYLGTARGRVALISAFDWGSRGRGDVPPSVPTGVIASEQSPHARGRPGVNLVRFQVVNTVDGEAFEALRRISRELKWEKEKADRLSGRAWSSTPYYLSGPEPADTESAFHFMGTKFVRGDRFTFETVPHAGDLERNYKWIREARRQADWVITSFHNHGAQRSVEEPSDHVRIFAQGAIDAGADVFVAHGNFKDGGIEIYKGKPILYGLKFLIMQNNQWLTVPYELAARWGGGIEDTAGEYFAGRESRSAPMAPRLGGALATVTFSRDRELRNVTVHPLEMAWGESTRFTQGLPVMSAPGSKLAEQTLEGVRKASAMFGSDVVIENGVAIVRPQGKANRVR